MKLPAYSLNYVVDTYTAIVDLMQLLLPTHSHASELLARRLAGRRRVPREANLVAATGLLQSMVGQGLSAIERLDTKAALVIPAVGVVAGLVVGRVTQDLPPQVWALGWTSALLAGIAVLYAAIALAGLAYAVGPNGVLTAEATSRPELEFRQQVIDSLAIALDEIASVAAQKGELLNRSLIAGAYSVTLLFVFAMAGGVK